MSEEGDNAPGWEAIDSVLKAVVGEREPDAHFGSGIPPFMGGPAIYGTSAYALGDKDSAYWLIVTYGLTDIFGMGLDDAEEEEGERRDITAEPSSYGFELTLHLPRKHDETEFKDEWAVSLLQNVGKYIESFPHIFGVGQYLPINGPIKNGDDRCLLTNLGFCASPILRETYPSPCGTFRFVHVYGLTDAEVELWKCWDGTKAVETIKSADALLLTDIQRTCWTEALPAFVEAAKNGAEKEGSAIESLLVSKLSWDVDEKGCITVSMGARSVSEFLALLKYRLLFGKCLSCLGNGGNELHCIPKELRDTYSDGYVATDPSTVEEDGATVEEEEIVSDSSLTVTRRTLTIEIPDLDDEEDDEEDEEEEEKNIVLHKLFLRCGDDVVQKAVESVRPIEGTYNISEKMNIRVERTEIKDATGKVVRVIGVE